MPTATAVISSSDRSGAGDERQEAGQELGRLALRAAPGVVGR